MTKTIRHSCPACHATLVADLQGTPLRCPACRWHLITLQAWKTLTPFQQGFALYMQGSWPTSEIAREKNPYRKGTPEWTEFCNGEQRAMLSAMDGEE